MILRALSLAYRFVSIAFLIDSVSAYEHTFKVRATKTSVLALYQYELRKAVGTDLEPVAFALFHPLFLLVPVVEIRNECAR